MSAPMILYTLPFPPSTNNLFANRKAGGRRISDAYRAWRKAAGEEILVQGRKRIHGPVSLSIGLVRPDRRKRDVSNAIKACEDLLVEMQIIDDDFWVQRVTAQWVSSGAPCTVLIQEAVQEMAA